MATGISILALLLLIMLALAIGAVVLIVLGLTGRRDTQAADGGACGGCGYSVKGLESLACPECGADLRQVGITKPTGRGGRNAMLTLGIILLVVLLGMCALSALMVGWVRVSSSPMPQPPPAHTVPAQPTPPANP